SWKRGSPSGWTASATTPAPRISYASSNSWRSSRRRSTPPTRPSNNGAVEAPLKAAMALLQISEPGQSPAPHEHRLAVGIDLGTTNSLVATVRSGATTVLPDAQGRPLLPSIVRYLGNGKTEVGYPAQARQADDPKNTIVSVKRFMGRGVKDVDHAQNAPYDFVDAPGMLQLRTASGVKSPVEVSAEILKVLRQRAELAMGGTLSGAA